VAARTLDLARETRGVKKEGPCNWFSRKQKTEPLSGSIVPGSSREGRGYTFLTQKCCAGERAPSGGKKRWKKQAQLKGKMGRKCDLTSEERGDEAALF